MLQVYMESLAPSMNEPVAWPEATLQSV
jgi:hypothetical protein